MTAPKKHLQQEALDLVQCFLLERAHAVHKPFTGVIVYVILAKEASLTVGCAPEKRRVLQPSGFDSCCFRPIPLAQ